MKRIILAIFTAAFAASCAAKPDPISTAIEKRCFDIISGRTTYTPPQTP